MASAGTPAASADAANAHGLICRGMTRFGGVLSRVPGLVAW
jgi:hypothetical protein